MHANPTDSSQSIEIRAHAAQPSIRIRPSSGPADLELSEIWRYRDLLLTFASRDLKLRYRQTALGPIWVVLQPLIAAGLFTFVFGKVAKLPSDGLPYILFSYAGLLGWNLFANTITRASTSLVGNTNLISKVYFPRLILPISTVFSVLADFGVALALLAVMLPIYHVAPSWGIVLLPVWMLILLLFGLGVGLYTAALTVQYRDVQYVLPVLLQFLLYASPIAYSISAVPKHLKAFYFINPLAPLLEAFRWSVLGHGHINVSGLVYSVVLAIAVFLIGTLAFNKMERSFADII